MDTAASVTLAGVPHVLAFDDDRISMMLGLDGAFVATALFASMFSHKEHAVGYLFEGGLIASGLAILGYAPYSLYEGYQQGNGEKVQRAWIGCGAESLALLWVIADARSGGKGLLSSSGLNVGLLPEPGGAQLALSARF